MFRVAIAIAVVIAMMTGAAYAAPADDAFAAFNRKDYATAFRIWEQCAKDGVDSCQFDLGSMYLDGEGRAVDVGAALYWMSRAAKQGNVKAQNRLGREYFMGKVVTRDFTRAMQYFMNAARQNYPAGQANVGLMYWRGYGVPVNLPEAFAWSELSTIRLPSGAKQRDDILKEMSPDQWTQGRDRAAALKKEFGPPKYSGGQIFDFIAGILTLVALAIGALAFIREKVMKRARAA